jgi:ankyrin repeat protein
MFSLLHHAAMAGNLEAVRMLLDFEPTRDVNERDFLGLNALDLCTNVEVARLLLERGANPRLVDKYGNTVLMKGGVVCARVLLEVAPDLISMRNRSGLTAVMDHSCSFSLRVDNLLEVLLRSCKEMGLDAGVNARAMNGDTALCIAIDKGSLPKIKLLVENGADVLSCGREDMTVFMRVLMSRTIGAYIPRPDGSLLPRDKAGVDSEMKECLQIMLDAVLLRGGGGEAVTGVRKSAAKTEDEPAAKRRKGRSV